MSDQASSASSTTIVPDAIELQDIARVLVLKLRHHGDVLLTSPLFSVLKSRAPHAAIDALVYDDTAEMLSLHPAIRMIHVIGRKWRGLGYVDQARKEWRLFRTLRAARYDLLVHLTDHPRGAWLARTLRVRAAVAPVREARWWKKSFTHRYPVVPDGRRHTVETNLDSLRRIGIQPGVEERALVLVPGREAVQYAHQLLAAHGLVEKQFIHVHPTSRWLFKCWPAPAVAAMIDTLEGRGQRVALTAAPAAKEREFIREVLACAHTHPVDLSGTLTLKQLAALTARARIFVGVDSAPMHIAAAMQTPVVALFGPSGEFEWGPWKVPHRTVVAAEFHCRPCGYDGCGGGKVSECLTSISPARVLAAIDELLGTA